MKPGKRPVPIATRFWARVSQRGADDCWLWAGQPSSKYGNIRAEGSRLHVQVHRLSYEMHHGPIPAGLQVLHRCDTPRCVNPAHLFAGTQLDNMRDMHAKGRGQTGERHHAAALTEEDVRQIRRRFGAETHAQIARDYPVGRGAITKIRTGERWAHVT